MRPSIRPLRVKAAAVRSRREDGDPAASALPKSFAQAVGFLLVQNEYARGSRQHVTALGEHAHKILAQEIGIFALAQRRQRIESS
jgi:hypothetical protein